MPKPDDSEDPRRTAPWYPKRAVGARTAVPAATTTSSELVGSIVSLVELLPRSRPALVAVDGGDAAGKTTFADSLGSALEPGRIVTRIEVDDFEQPRDYRYRQGSDSPVGYLEDTYDHDAFEDRVLRPLVVGDRRIVRQIYDRKTDAPVEAPVEEIPTDGVVVVDGCFLLRRRFRGYWSLGVLLVVDEEERLRRAMSRDRVRLGGSEGVAARYRTRYFPGFDLYLEREDPLDWAHVVVDNGDVDRPVVLRWPSGRPEPMLG